MEDNLIIFYFKDNEDESKYIKDYDFSSNDSYNFTIQVKKNILIINLIFLFCLKVRNIKSITLT